MEICFHYNSNECCLTANPSKHIWINTALQTKNKSIISEFYFKLQITSVVERVPMKSKERLPDMAVYSSYKVAAAVTVSVITPLDILFISFNFEKYLSAFSYLSD
jgi:hypothetical protein